MIPFSQENLSLSAEIIWYQDAFEWSSSNQILAILDPSESKDSDFLHRKLFGSTGLVDSGF